MNKQTIDQLELKGKTVLIRVDFNVPIKNKKVESDKRIVEALPTIKHAIKAKAKIVLFSHLSRIKTLEDKKTKSLKVVAELLAEKLKKEVIFVSETRGKKLEKAIKDLKPGGIIMVENTRFEDVDKEGNVVKYESKNDVELGKYWASLGDVFINDAFGTAHRAHASNVGIASNIKESAIGFLVAKELDMLGKGLNKPEKPFVAIIGGAKISDKIAVVENLLKKSDMILIGGGMAYTFLKAQGIEIGKSLVEEDYLELAKSILKKGKNKVILPVDHLVCKEFADKKATITKNVEIPKDTMGLDIGPKTIKLYEKSLKGAKTIIWNGPMGVAEFKNYKVGTEAVAKAITMQKGVFSIIGGGDSAAAAINLGFEKKFSHISTGGGASLEFMEGKVLPGIEAIQDGQKKKTSSAKPNIKVTTTKPKTTIVKKATTTKPKTIVAKKPATTTKTKKTNK